jgi:hypothetical protein
LKTLSFTLLALAVAPIVAQGQFQFRDLNSRSVELSENGSPVFVYNYGMMLKAGVPADRARCCYLHPVYAPNGIVITDDFPRDHYHHRGISWMWPVVIVDGKTYDLWTIKGILARFEKWNRKEAANDKAVLAFQDGWYVGDRKVVDEDVEIIAYPVANGRRDLDFTLRLRSDGTEVSIGGTHERNKGYGGGLNIRFAPCTSTKIRTAAEDDAPDRDLRPAAWAELTGVFAGKQTTTRVTIDPSNPGAPNGWCLRHYGFLGVEYPGLDSYHLASNKPLTMKFRISLAGSSSVTGRPDKNILVYTRNSNGYVHDNIQTSVEAIKKMGAENGWYHEFDGGREYYLALGHNKAHYSNPILYDEILGGILCAMGEM